MPARRQLSNISKSCSNSHLSNSKITRILTLDHTDFSTHSIASKIMHNQSTISHILQIYYYKTFDIHDRTRIRRQKIIKQENRILTRTAKANDDQAYRIIYISGIKVSRNILHYCWKEIDLYSCIHHQKFRLKVVI